MDNPKSYGPLILTDLYHEVRKAHSEVYKKVPQVVLEVAKEFEKNIWKRLWSV